MKFFGLVSSALGFILFSTGMIVMGGFTNNRIVPIIFIGLYLIFIFNFIVFYPKDVYIIGVLPLITKKFKVEKSSITKISIIKTHSSRLTLKSIELYNIESNRIKDVIINFLPFEEKQFKKYLKSINIEGEGISRML